jgi:hypothetical protein
MNARAADEDVLSIVADDADIATSSSDIVLVWTKTGICSHMPSDQLASQTTISLDRITQEFQAMPNLRDLTSGDQTSQ